MGGPQPSLLPPDQIRSGRCYSVVPLLCAALLSAAPAATYDVGPGRKYATISQIAGRLVPGDVVLVRGDIADSLILTRSGAEGAPITIRGVKSDRSGVSSRPRVVPAHPDDATITCGGDWNILEGLDLPGNSPGAGRLSIGIRHDCDHLTIRDCRLHHFNFKAIVGTPAARSITLTLCEFDSCGTVAGTSGKTVDIWSWKAGSVVRIEHCYFHDALGQCHLKTHAPRNIIRYNWFENAYSESLNITDRITTYCPDRPEGSYPMHSDVVGNVFIEGYSPGIRYSTLSTGGHGVTEPGPEGDLNYAHNLFSSRSRPSGQK